MVRRESRLLQITIYGIMLLFLGWLGYTIIYGNGGILERRETEKTLSLLESEIDELGQEIERIDLEIRNLSENRKNIAGLARELGYKQEGEIVFRFLLRKDRSRE